MKWAKTTDQLNAMNTDHIDPAAIDQCIEVYEAIMDDGTITEDGKKKKKIKGEKNASTSDTFTEWVTYPLTQDSKESKYYPKKFFPELYSGKPLDLNKEGRERYEIFCGGFLFYHDVIVKEYYDRSKWKEYYGKENNIEIFEHKIYFEWFGEGDTKLDATSTEIAKKVTIYITPTLTSLNPDPPDPPGGPPPY